MAVTDDTREDLEVHLRLSHLEGLCEDNEQHLHGIIESLLSLHVKVDELLDDTRKVRPLMDKYLGMANKPWASIGKGKHRG